MYSFIAHIQISNHTIRNHYVHTIYKELKEIHSFGSDSINLLTTQFLKCYQSQQKIKRGSTKNELWVTKLLSTNQSIRL